MVAVARQSYNANVLIGYEATFSVRNRDLDAKLMRIAKDLDHKAIGVDFLVTGLEIKSTASLAKWIFDSCSKQVAGQGKVISVEIRRQDGCWFKFCSLTS